MKQNKKNFFSDWTLFEKIWLITFTSITIYLFFAWGDTWIGLIASLTGMLSVVLTAKGKISSYYFGIPNILTYAYIAYQNKYYGEVQLNLLFFLPMSIYGIIMWKQHINKKKTKDDILVRYLGMKERIFWIITVIIGIIAYAAFLKLIKGSMPGVDAATNVLSIVAMILLVKRVVEQYICWILVNILSIWMWLKAFMADGNDITILVMWIAYLVTAFYGYMNWKKLERSQHVKN